MPDRVAIIGSGGHAVVIADALLSCGMSVDCFLDVAPERIGGTLLGIAIASEADFLESAEPSEVLMINGIGGVGSLAKRIQIQQRLAAGGWRFMGACHPTAVVSDHAVIASDAQIMASAVIQPGAIIGAGTIVNTGAIIEHGVKLGTFVHISPGAVVCGDCEIGDGCYIGAGAVIRNAISLGARTIAGAGATIVSDFSGDGVLVGTPARPMETR